MIPVVPPGDEFSLNQFDERRINKLVRDSAHAIVELQDIVGKLVEREMDRRRPKRG